MTPRFELKAPNSNYINLWYRRSGKELIDRSASLVLLILLFPIMVLIGITIRLTLGRRVIFVQCRAGLHGRSFNCYKYRTMDPDRRKLIVDPFMPDRRSGIPSVNDPRHRTFGSFLRRFGLDELPQLINVLRGEMSLVGPRPEIKEISLRYSENEKQRFMVKPGLTGYWQVTCRSAAVDLRTHVDRDIEYAKKVSIMNDVRIILRTPFSLLFLPAATECRREPLQG